MSNMQIRMHQLFAYQTILRSRWQQVYLLEPRWYSENERWIVGTAEAGAGEESRYWWAQSSNWGINCENESLGAAEADGRHGDCWPQRHQRWDDWRNCEIEPALEYTKVRSTCRKATPQNSTAIASQFRSTKWKLRHSNDQNRWNKIPPKERWLWWAHDFIQRNLENHHCTFLEIELWS